MPDCDSGLSGEQQRQGEERGDWAGKCVFLMVP